MDDGSKSGPAASDENETPIHAKGRFAALAEQAGLEPREAGHLPFTEYFPDTTTMLRGFMSAPPFVRAASVVGEDAVREALTEAVGPLRTADGSVSLSEEATYVIAKA
jgi:hypothetical protein